MAFDSSSTRLATDGWRQCPVAFLREPVVPDVTSPPPIVVPRDVYAAVRGFCREAHGVSIGRYALAAGVGRFCEFALLRGFALTRQRERYAWVDAAQHSLLPGCRNFWSRAQTPASVAGTLPPELAATVSAPLSVEGY